MDNLTNLILEKKKQIEKNKDQTPTRYNLKWERAKDFCEYCGFKPSKGIIIFILKLCKNYGDDRVYGLKSWVKDYNYDPNRLQGLLVWKLKKDLAEKKLTTGN